MFVPLAQSSVARSGGAEASAAAVVGWWRRERRAGAAACALGGGESAGGAARVLADTLAQLGLGSGLALGALARELVLLAGNWFLRGHTLSGHRQRRAAA